MEKRTIVDSRTIQSDGVINVRLAKQIVDGDIVIDQKWHRVVFSPGDDVEQIMLLNDLSLQAQVPVAYPAVDNSEWQKVRDLVAQEWTPDVIAAYTAAHPIPPSV